MQAVHTAIDGSTVTITSPRLASASKPSSVGVYAIAGRWHEFTTSYKAFGQAVADDLGVALTETYSFQGGTLRLGTGGVHFPDVGTGQSQTDLIHLGVWEGRQYSIHTHLYNGNRHDLISVFEHFDIIEHPQGIYLRPHDAYGTPHAKEPAVLQELHGVGLLYITPLTQRVARNVPKWQGARVAGGELFIGRRPGSVHFALVGQRSHTLIMREGDACHDDDLAAMKELVVDWQPSAVLVG